MQEEVIYIADQPGEGATAFARQITEGMTRAEIIEILPKLFDGSYYDPTDRRIKRCAYCGFYWRDDSLRNTKKTCCDECHTGKKTIQRQEQRRKKKEHQALLEPEKKPKKKRKLEDDYIYWLEYPYWLNEKSMISYDEKYISRARKQDELIEFINSKNQIYGEGNRKTPIRKNI